MSATLPSPLSPVDPSTVPESEREVKSSWLVQKLLGSLTGRVTIASFESLRSSGLSIVCLSPWGDAMPLMLPCIRGRDLAIHTAIAMSGGTATFAGPWLGTFGDAVIGGLGDSILVEVGTSAAWDVGNKIATDLLFEKAGKILSPEHGRMLTTTAVKELMVTIKFKHHSLTDAVLGFFRASALVHPDPSLFASVGEYLSTQKGWFAPYLQASARRPFIPRTISPDVIYSHGPFLPGDYALATRLAAESANLLYLAPSPTPPPTPTPTPPTATKNSSTPVPPRNLLLTVIGLAPHRMGMWSTSHRPGESVIKYLLLNGCPAVVFPILPGTPLIAWNTLTLETLHSYRTELDSSGAPKLDSKKFNGIVDSLFEYLSLCVDFTRLQLPAIPEGREAVEDAEEKGAKCVRDAIALIVEGAVRSGLPASLKVLKKDVDVERAGIAMWRMP